MSEKLVPFPISWRKMILESTLPPTTRHVALTLSTYMSEMGSSAHPGPTRLSRDTGLHLSTVKEQLGRLVRDGWLTVVERGGLKGEARRANVYAATIPDLALPLPVVEDDPSPTATGGSEGTAPVVQDDPISPENSPTTTPPNPPVPGGNESADDRRELERALADVTGDHAVGGAEVRRRQKAVDELVLLDATPAQVRAKAVRWREQHSGQKLSARALLRTWSSLTPKREPCVTCSNQGMVLDDDGVAHRCPDCAAAA